LFSSLIIDQVNKENISHCQADYKDEEYWKKLLTIISNSVNNFFLPW